MTASERSNGVGVQRAARGKRAPIVPVAGMAFALLAILVLATPFIEMTAYVPADVKIYRIYGYGLVLVLLAILVPIRGWKRSLLLAATPLAAAFGWFTLSLIWSAHTGLSSRRLVLLAIVYLGVVSSVCDLGARRSLAIMRMLLVVLLAINFLAVISFHDLATQSYHKVPLWRGLMGHKNIAGLASAATVLLLALGPGKLSAAFRFAVIAPALVFLYFSGSRTPVLALALALPLGLALPHLTLKPVLGRNRFPSVFSLAVLTFGAGIFALLVLTLQRDLLISLTDDQAAFSVRNMIWRPMVQFYVDHPLLGAGYGAYWDGSSQSGPDNAFGGQAWLRNVDQGHNGYLDLLVQTGIIGLALALGAVLLWPLRRLAAMHAHEPRRAAFTASLIIFMLVENMFESSLLADDTLGNLLLLFALAQVRHFELNTRGVSRLSRKSDDGPAFQQGRSFEA